MLRYFIPLIVCTELLAHPVPESPHWLTYSGGDGPDKGKHVVLIVNAAYWRLEVESAIIATRSVDVIGECKPLKSGFNHRELGVEPQPVSAYK